MSVEENSKFEKAVDQMEAELGEEHVLRIVQYLTSNSPEASQGLIDLHTQCREVISKYPPLSSHHENLIERARSQGTFKDVEKTSTTARTSRVQTEIFTSTTKDSDLHRFDNSVVGIPVISCERDRIRIEVETSRPFAGKVFVKGEYANRECVRSYVDGIPLPSHGGQSSSTRNRRPTQHETKIEEAVEVPTRGSWNSGAAKGPVQETVAESKLASRFIDDSALKSRPVQNARDTGVVVGPNQFRPNVSEHDGARFTNEETITKDENTMFDNFHYGSRWFEHGTVSSTNEKVTGDKTAIPDHGSANSAWSGYGGVSAASGIPNQFLGVFGGSRKEESHPQLKIYSKTKSNEANKLLNPQYVGPQGLLSANCPLKCEPCACSKEEQPQERKRRTTNHVELSVPLGACNAKRDRKLSPPTLLVSFVAVVSFHESFITKLDRAYHIQCAYVEINKTLSTKMDVGTAAASSVNGTATAPICDYHISGENGRSIQNIQVGERVVHVWNCTTTAPKLYSMLVHSCFVEDGAGQRYEVIDKHGCSLDPYILNTPRYEKDKLTASVDAFMMKFPDRSSVDFQCAIKICSKLDERCSDITPPDCSSPETLIRRPRALSKDDESMTIHSNSLVVLDMDMVKELPQHLAHTQAPWFPTEFCLSVAGFGILVSASTFLTTVTLGVALANIYMRAQHKW